MSDTEFIKKLADAIGEDFCYSDMIWQEKLFAKQEKVMTLIVDASNSGNRLANIFVRKWDSVFNVVEVDTPPNKE